MMNISRRDMVKSLLGIPVLGGFVYEFMRKWQMDSHKKTELFSELGLNTEKKIVKISKPKKEMGKTIRIGIIGFGARGRDLATGLGFAMPDWIARAKRIENRNSGDKRFTNWMMQDDLNVQITGICDVYDTRAEEGLVAAKSNAKVTPAVNPKRYRHYHEMLNSSEIDAVIITTPDFHHAQMTIDAVAAGKHVYCEKCMTRTEEETHNVYEAVKGSNIVFQLGHQSPQSDIYQKAREIISRNILGKITMIETNSNRNTAHGAWIRHLDKNGQPRPGSTESIDWKQWLGKSPQVPFNIDRFYNWTKWFDYGTGLSGQLFSHEYDALNQVLDLGIPTSATASGGIYFYKDNREIPDIFHAVFEFPDRDLTLTYSASLASSAYRPKTIYAHDAMMELSSDIKVKADRNSSRYNSLINTGTITTDAPMFTYRPGAGQIDAITSATEKYYAVRGLLYTYRDGRQVDVSHLHLKDWLECIRNGGKPKCDIDRAFDVTMACHMATRAYLEQRRVVWDEKKRRIV